MQPTPFAPQATSLLQSCGFSVNLFKTVWRENLRFMTHSFIPMPVKHGRTVIGLFLVTIAFVFWLLLYVQPPAWWAQHLVAAFSIAYFFVLIFAAAGIGAQSAQSRSDANQIIYNYFLDVVISGFLCVFAFAGLFVLREGYAENTDITSPGIALYFSIVSFSTLGYGDFAPAAPSRFWAASLAVIGNLHLGLFVASIFLLFQRSYDVEHALEKTDEDQQRAKTPVTPQSVTQPPQPPAQSQ